MNTTATLSPEEAYWAIRLEKAAKALRANNFGVSIHATAREAAEYLVRDMLTPAWKGDVNFGGSMSVAGSGVVELLKTLPGAEVVDTYTPGLSRDIVHQLRAKHFFSQLYLCSSNAVTMSGQLLNLDKSANRVAAMHYGPKKVVLFVGRNKLCDSMEEARVRVKDYASPINALKIVDREAAAGKTFHTPCTVAGRCVECKTKDRICNVWTVTEKSYPAERIHILLINEKLGY